MSLLLLVVWAMALVGIPKPVQAAEPTIRVLVNVVTPRLWNETPEIYVLQRSNPRANLRINNKISLEASQNFSNVQPSLAGDTNTQSRL